MLPPDARAAIEPAAIAGRGGRALHGQWRVRFPPRWASTLDRLTGLTGGGDPLATIDLRFPDPTSAENYCRRQGLHVTARRPVAEQVPVDPRLPDERPPILCCSPTGPHAMCCGRYPVANAAPDLQRSV